MNYRKDRKDHKEEAGGGKFNLETAGIQRLVHVPAAVVVPLQNAQGQGSGSGWRFRYGLSYQVSFSAWLWRSGMRIPRAGRAGNPQAW